MYVCGIVLDFWRIAQSSMDYINMHSFADIDVDNLNAVSFRFKSDNEDLANIDDIVLGTQVDAAQRSWHGNVTVYAKFLGSARIYAEMTNSLDQTTTQSKEHFDIVIIRERRIIDHIFTGSVILLVSLLYINFGAALDLQVLKDLIKKPVVSRGALAIHLYVAVILYLCMYEC